MHKSRRFFPNLCFLSISLSCLRDASSLLNGCPSMHLVFASTFFWFCLAFASFIIDWVWCMCAKHWAFPLIFSVNAFGLDSRNKIFYPFLHFFGVRTRLPTRPNSFIPGLGRAGLHKQKPQNPNRPGVISSVRFSFPRQPYPTRPVISPNAKADYCCSKWRSRNKHFSSWFTNR